MGIIFANQDPTQTSFEPSHRGTLGRRTLKAGGLSAALMASLIACSSSSKSSSEGSQNSVSSGNNFSDTNSSMAPAPSTEAGAPGTLLTFDDLGGGLSIIMVYPGVKATTADRKFNGTYETGQVVSAICKTAGRLVVSNTTVGEASRQSSEWVQIEGTPGETQYATMTYADIAKDALSRLPECQSVK